MALSSHTFSFKHLFLLRGKNLNVIYLSYPRLIGKEENRRKLVKTNNNIKNKIKIKQRKIRIYPILLNKYKMNSYFFDL